MNNTEEKVLQFLHKHNLINKTIIVGFSGGHDSMCLMQILYKLSTNYNFRLIAAHLNHNWRGAESNAEQETCRKFCLDRNIEFFTKTLNDKVKKSETVARAIRYEFFDSAINKYNADACFTAHNKNDNAETVLYRIIKGTGINGLKGIHEKRGKIYRPILNITREEIDKYCFDEKLLPNEDSSNVNTKYKRNYIRHELMPLLLNINKNVVSSLNILSSVTDDETKIINEYITLINNKIYKNNCIITDEYLKLSSAVKRKIIYNMLISNNIEYDFDKIHLIYDFIEGNARSKNGVKISLTKNIWLYVSLKSIEIIYKTNKILDEVEIKSVGEYRIGNYIFEISEYNEKIVTEYPKDDSLIAYINLNNTELNFVLRTRRDGDIINPFGMDGSMKLKKYLISKSIPQHKKDSIILLSKGNEIYWVAGFGLSNKIYVTDKPTHKIKLIKINEE